MYATSLSKSRAETEPSPSQVSNVKCARFEKGNVVCPDLSHITF